MAVTIATRDDVARARDPGSDSRYYSVFGGVLRSALDFPELRTISPARADWTLDVAATPAHRTGLLAVGQRSIGVESYELSRFDTGFRLDYSHAGAFDLDVTTRSMTWYPGQQASPELARVIVLGPLFALLLESSGHFCLHGSGVVTAEGAIAFIGPKHHGKSTLALALTASGCHFASDDTVAILPGSPPVLRPSVPTMRLWSDTMQTLITDALCERVIPGAKTTVGGFAASVVADRPADLRAIYSLAPVAAEAGRRTIERRPVRGAEGVVTLAQQRKLPDVLVGMTNAGAQLAQAGVVAAAVPVWTLHVARDFSCLADAVARILEWHGGPPPAAVPSSADPRSAET